MLRLEPSDPMPLYQQVKARLLGDIRSGTLAPDAAIPDERSLAAQLGLSRMTVRRAIVELTDDGWFERIPGRGTFVRAPSAQPQRGRRATPPSETAAGAIGVVAHFDQTGVRSTLFYHRILHGAQQALGAESTLVIHKATPPYTTFAASIAKDAQLSGLIVLGVVERDLLNALAAVELPTVLVDSEQPAQRRFDQVSCESIDGAEAAVAALVALGHRDIAIMNYPSTPAADARQAGYQRALTSAGIAHDPALSYRVACDSDAAYAAMGAVLAGGRVPTAVFCTT
ncbi:MAG: GntR family transcriptional regulator, partial [Planctomycetes bacterium]|nr:GntR family transcriptional regulator [Planctomycetota bacterium]